MLTNQQKDDLNKAVYDYLRHNQLESTQEKFREECQTNLDSCDDKAPSDILEKKWISIIRLQKKIIDLEGKAKDLENEIQTLSKFKRKDLRPEETELLMPKPPSKSVQNGHKGVVNKVEFHPFYTTIGSAGEDASIKLWDFETGLQEQTLKGHTKSINSLSFESSGNFLATASSDLSIKIWDLNENVCIKTLNGHDHTVSSVQWNPDGTHILSASRDATLKIWEVSSGYCLKTLHGHKEWIRMAVYNESGTQMASAGNEQTIMLWTIQKDEPIMTMYGHEHVIEILRFCKEETKITIHEAKWNTETAHQREDKEKPKDLDDIIKESKERLEKRNSQMVTGIQEIEQVPENPLLNIEYIISAGRDKTIRIFSCQTGGQLKMFVGHDNWVRDLAFHHSNKYLVNF